MQAAILTNLNNRIAPAIFVALVCSNAAAAAVFGTNTGTARLEDGSVAYIESHTYVTDDAGKLLSSRTEYKDPGGAVIATMDSDYARTRDLPTYTFVDKRNQYQEGLRWEDGRYWLFFQEPGKNEEKTALESLPNTFSCQGWSFYLGERLKSAAAKDLRLRLVLPSKQAAYDFVTKSDSTVDGRVRLSVVVENVFLRMFAPSLKLEYAETTGRLLRYEGPTNIADKNNKYPNVIITYEYKDPGATLDRKSVV